MEMTCCAFELPVGVIAPIVPTLLQTVGPVLLVLGFTFIVAIPRWFLGLARISHRNYEKCALPFDCAHFDSAQCRQGRQVSTQTACAVFAQG